MRNLPDSYSKPFGRLAKYCRIGVARMLLQICGKHVNIEKDVLFLGQVEFGNNSVLGINCYVGGEVTIGNNAIMAPECKIYTLNHSYDRLDIPIGL
ncbi:MAG: hypothetical protein RR413_04580 [Christensenellaceae bacterium]